MSLLLNLLWIVLGGFLVFILYLIGGLVLCLTIVGIPFGVQLFKLSVLGLMPFGREVNTEGSASDLLSIVMNVLWWIFGGVEVALVHLVLALILAINPGSTSTKVAVYDGHEPVFVEVIAHSPAGPVGLQAEREQRRK